MNFRTLLLLLRGKRLQPTSDQPLADLMQRLGYRFRDPDLLKTAISHRSTLAEPGMAYTMANERLEFLGDAVLGLIVSDALYRKNRNAHEGELTQLRAELVSKKNLARVATEMNLGRYLRLSSGEEKSGGRERPSNLANLFESILGAVFLDGGYEMAERFVIANIFQRKFKEPIHVPLVEPPKKTASKSVVANASREDTKTRRAKEAKPVDIHKPVSSSGGTSATGSNFKGLLLERLQREGKKQPRYTVISEDGPDHSKKFVSAVVLGTEELGRGQGHSKKESEQEAARMACFYLGVIPGDREEV